MLLVRTESDLILGSGTTINGEAIQTGEDQDSLAGISCSGGEVLVYDVLSSNWVCGSDQDTTLTESEVRTMMEGASGLSLNLTSTSNVDGAAILTSDTTLEVDWNNINNRPTGLDDGDDVTNALDALGCSQGQIHMKGDTGWECKEFSSVLVNDGDGALQWNDCDDSDENVGDQSNDADCDGTITADDCDDSNANITTQGTGTSSDCASTSCKKSLMMDMEVQMEHTISTPTIQVLRMKFIVI